MDVFRRFLSRLLSSVCHRPQVVGDGSCDDPCCPAGLLSAVEGFSLSCGTKECCSGVFAANVSGQTNRGRDDLRLQAGHSGQAALKEHTMCHSAESEKGSSALRLF